MPPAPGVEVLDHGLEDARRLAIVPGKVVSEAHLVVRRGSERRVPQRLRDHPGSLANATVSLGVPVII